ncbi:hypothetical protein LTR09_010966 [Extremus antarcticus]|uniref:Uncharacterized protein n=1 Tax=Extremus antarcticus TaxID=702011 RepID=A0AAJ0DCS0_9PEZI|nr:hypothetical protein LTR09_010966 [Extremus antarcticus]
MAESESRDPPDSNASTPDSHSATQRDLKASKDRNCPFCGQAFTSSSLGRHLDLYIKPRNPKPPDGVHDVDGIRRIRGGITRRQPRTSSNNGEYAQEGAHERHGSSSWSRHEEQQDGERSKRRRLSDGRARVTDRGYVNSPIEAREGGMQTFFNAPNWQATGVINDLPARAPSRSHNATPSGGEQAARVQEMRRDGAGNRVERPDWAGGRSGHGEEDMWKLQESAEIGKAAEMALREVLGSLEAAKKKAEPRQLYDEFDFFALSFPGLCLAILPSPPSLFSSTPFAAAHTWSLAPPGEKQYEALNRMMNERIAWLRPNGKRDNLTDSVAFRYVVHSQGAWEHWQLMSESDKASAWMLELSRAYAAEKVKKNDLRVELDSAQQRIQHLEAEYDRLSRCQLPREYLLHPPNTVPVSPNVMREMRSSHSKTAAAEADYDAEALLEKWRTVVKSTAKPAKHQTSTAAHSQPYHVETQRNPMRGDMIMNGSMFGIGGPMPRDADGTYVTQYETPRASGMIVNADEEVHRDDGVEVDADGEIEGVDDDHRNGAVVTRSRNGKRRFEPDSATGKGSGVKMYREQLRS